MFPSSKLILLLLAAFLLALPCAASSKADDRAISAATGVSVAKDPMQAGVEAARNAKTALGKRVARVVLVFDCVGSSLADKEKLLQGVGSVFDSSLIFGCSGFCPITQQSNKGSVGVMAICGDIEVTSAVRDLVGGQKACGKRIGYDLRQAANENKAKGSLLILLGDCHVPADDRLVSGAKSVLGEAFPIAGAAHPLDGFLYYKGKPVQDSNLGLLITGNLKCGFSAKSASDAQGIVRTAGEAVREAVGGAKDRTSVVLVFNCVSRLQALGDKGPDELRAITDAAGSAPVFGLYGSGEIGPSASGSPANGVGGHIIACAIQQ